MQWSHLIKWWKYKKGEAIRVFYIEFYNKKILNF